MRDAATPLYRRIIIVKHWLTDKYVFRVHFSPTSFAPPRGWAERVVAKPEKRQIFVVEDDDAVRASTRTLLEAEGFLVRDFASAEIFLQVTNGQGADCIVLDHNLSGMSGLDLMAMLRAKDIATPAIIVCGNSKPLRAQADRLGIVAVLSTPLMAEALLEWLERLVCDS